ncbi:MAG: MBOAT family protein, partial [Marinilabiliales bacterium]
YISIGGNRKGVFRTYVNLLVTMVLGGLWHGANIKFVIWGALHGAALAIHKFWMKINPFKQKKNKLTHFLAVSSTFHFVSFAWIFFRAENWDKAWQMIGQLIQPTEPEIMIEMINAYKFVFILIALALIFHWLPSYWKEYYRGLFIKTPIWVKVFIVSFVVFVLYQVSSLDLQPFIYFRF